MVSHETGLDVARRNRPFRHNASVTTTLLERGPLWSRAIAHASRIMIKNGVTPAPSDGTDKKSLREYRVFSQHGEDGILDCIFDQIGFTDKFFVEIGFSTVECNALLLAKNHRFAGLWIDGNTENCAIAERTAKLLRWNAIRVRNEFVTAENITTILHDNIGHSSDGVIDLFSIDIDGVDYWVLKEVTGLRPRVLVCEYNAIFGPDRAVTVPYDPRFNRFDYHPQGLWFGASLKAFEKLAGSRGYRLIGTDSSGTNAFFVDRSISACSFPTLTSEQCWRPMAYWSSERSGMDDKFRDIAGLPLVEV